MKKVEALIPTALAKRMERVLPSAELAGLVENLLEKEIARREREAAYQSGPSQAHRRSGNGNGDSFLWDNASGHF
ncbi:MAG: hypothetical protein ABSH25_15650 [Syntrophorhabdales bacterium]|jgi:hypothetical protein